MSGTSGFSHKYNTDDVLIRAVIVGLVNTLNEKVYIQNTVSDTEVKVVPVPFFYAFSGDERFLQDYFSDWSDCAPAFIEGNYDPIPRGSLQLTGVNVAANAMTSRFVRGYYVKEEKGELLRYNSYLNSIPMNFTFKVDIMVDSTIDSFKITQEIIKVFYKTAVFRVNFNGTVVPSQAGFSEGYTINKLFEYTYGENSRITISFDLEVESYFPVFDKQQEMFAGTRINYVTNSVDPTMAEQKAKASITPPSSVVEYPGRNLTQDVAGAIGQADNIGGSPVPNSDGGVSSLNITPITKTTPPGNKKSGENYWE